MKTDIAYRGPEVCKMVGITYRQLDYWTRTGLVHASVADAHGSGTQRLYNDNDLLQLLVIKKLCDAGASLQKVRLALDYIRDHSQDWKGIVLVVDGGGVYACSTGDELFDILRSSQGVFGAVIDVDEVRTHLSHA